jgi:hypothetical protein
MNTDDEARRHLDLIRQAMRSGDTDTPPGHAVARLKRPFVLGGGEEWLYEGLPKPGASAPHQHGFGAGPAGPALVCG